MEWSKRLAGLTGEEIKRGLDEWTGDWPPSADEFLKTCKGQKDGEHWAHNTQAYRILDKSKLLTHQKAQKKVANEEKSKIWEKLK